MSPPEGASAARFSGGTMSRLPAPFQIETRIFPQGGTVREAESADWLLHLRESRLPQAGRF